MTIDHIAQFPLLTLMVFLPIVGVAPLAFIPREQPQLLRTVSVITSVLTFLVSLAVFFQFDEGLAGLQMLDKAAWHDATVSYALAVDGISLLLVVLTTFLTPLVLISARHAIEDRVKEFVIAVLVLETGMLGALLAVDLFLFYVFWEFMLIPMYLLIGVWGGPRRIYAAVKFFIYTMVGSLLMLVGIIYLYLQAGSASFVDVLALDLSSTEQLWLFAAFALAFAIKVPFFPFHTWLPDAHVEAPTAGSVILAGVLLKMGTYGFIRFAIPLFPDAAGSFSLPLVLLAVVGIVYGALVAYAQSDIKKLVAYSSVSHLGFVMLGMFAMNPQGLQGSILQMVNHGISTGALFLLVGVIYQRRHTREMGDFGGLARVMPLFAFTFVVITLSSIGLPGTNGFVGEFLILAGAFADGLSASGGIWQPYMIAMAALAATGVVLGAVYMLTMVRKVMFGPVVHEVNKDLPDLTSREIVVLGPMLALVFVIGLFPNIFLDKTRASVDAYVQNYRPRVTAGREAPAPPPAAEAALLVPTDTDGKED